MKMHVSILAGALVSLLPAFTLAAVMPDNRPGMSAALSAIPDPDKDAQRVDLVKDQVKPPGGILVNLRPPTQGIESQLRVRSQPQAKTSDARIAPATRVHIFWFFSGR
jgi:hypothetical protein